MAELSQKERLARSILTTLHNNKHEAYFAGGSVRDRLLGTEPKDFDIATSAHPDVVQKLFERTVPVGAQFGVILVILEGTPFEVATFRTESGYQDGRRPTQVDFANVKEDAERRDFTVNGLYYDIQNEKVLDFVGGQKDLKAKVIRTIGKAEERFLEDHLRMLRAVRFSVQLDFEIEKEIIDVIQKHCALLAKVSNERIREEFSKTLCSLNPAQGMRLLDECGLLKVFLPEVLEMKGVEQPMEYHPEGDVWIHTLLLLEGLQKNSPVELALGALFHDIAKPQTFERAPDRIRFHGHDVLGAKMTGDILKRLSYPNQTIDLVCALVRDHLKFKDVQSMRVSTLKRFIGQERFDLHLELHRLDCLASHGELALYEFAKEKYNEFKLLPPPPRKLLTGADLQKLGYRSGPEMGKMLRSLEDAILEGHVSTRDEAEAFIAKKYPREKK